MGVNTKPDSLTDWSSLIKWLWFFSLIMHAACFPLTVCVAYSSTLKVDGTCSYKTLVNYYWTIQDHRSHSCSQHFISNTLTMSIKTYYKGNSCMNIPIQWKAKWNYSDSMSRVYQNMLNILSKKGQWIFLLKINFGGHCDGWISISF